MDTEQLRAMQTPLKERYREDPASAAITLSAAGDLAGEGITCSVRTGRTLVEAGLHPATGGDGSSACSGDMLLEALVACAGVTLRAVATSMGIAIRYGEVQAEGDLDVRGTLGVDLQAPVGFRAIRLTFRVETDPLDANVAKLLELTERYCVVLRTLTSAPPVTIRTEAATDPAL